MSEYSYNYNQYAQDKHVNVIPEQDFKKLVTDTFETICETLKGTYGPYGSIAVINIQNETTTTKDGYNVFESMSFNHPYKRMVYLAIKKICERVNRNVGDGTTSCILLANEMFKNISKLLKTPDDKRNILNILNVIESDLISNDKMQNDNDPDIHKKLDISNVENVIKLAANGDKKLAATITEAFDPKLDDDKNVKSIRNVMSEVVNDIHATESTLTVEHIPGNYHVRIQMDPDLADYFSTKRKVRIVMYDHAMTVSDWNMLEKPPYPDQDLIILARDFTKDLLDHAYVQYARGKMALKEPVNMILVWVKGDVRNEMKDLAQMLKTDARGVVSDQMVKYEDLPETEISIFNKNCMCFDFKAEDIPTHYIEKLKDELNQDTSNSMTTYTKYMSRINDLSLKADDTIIKCVGNNSLELKMIMDKIDDCTSIINSAFKYGIVPNMLKYGLYRVLKLAESTTDELMKKTVNMIQESIFKMFRIIYNSKYGLSESSVTDSNYENIVKMIYEIPDYKGMSYDIINDSFVDKDELPTSAQYDLEVISAAISIVKYLLTAKSFIFDPATMAPMMMFNN